MRVSHRFMYDSVINNIMHNASRLAEANQIISSGKQIINASQDPAKASVILALRTRLTELDQYTKNIADASSWLTETENAIAAKNDIMQRVRVLTVQGLNDTNSQHDRDAIATEIEQLISGMTAVSNRQLAGKYLFAGQNHLVTPFTGSPPTYNGDTGTLMREIAPGIQLDIGTDGETAFNMGSASIPGDPDTFTALQELVDALRISDAAAMNEGLSRIDRAIDQSLDVQTEIGSKLSIIERAKTDLDDTHIRVLSLLSNAEDADLAKAITDSSMRQATYEASLGVSARMIQTSLLDFLR